MPGFLVVSKGRSTSDLHPVAWNFYTSFLIHFSNDLFPGKRPPELQNGAQMEPELCPDPGFYDFPGTLFLCNTTWFWLDFLVFRVPDLPQEPFFFVVLLRPPKSNTNFIFIKILVSFWVPVRGGITHFSGSVCLHSRTEREFCKITPTKHMVFEAISGASAHLGPPRSQNGPGHPPRSPNDPQNMIFYPFFSIFG